MFGGKRYFREVLAGSEEGIASNILAELRTTHLGAPAPPRNGPSVMERL
jgi:hypothetical protein